MKIAIDAGHNVRCDTGARGLEKTEDVLTLDLAHKLMALLKLENHDCVFVTPKTANSLNHSLMQRVRLANDERCDLFVSLHFNALNHAAFGTEVLVFGNRARKVAKNVLNEICKLGFFNRGIKERNLCVLKHSKMPAILVECCFCDNSSDMAKYDSANMAIALKNGILGKVGSYEHLKAQSQLKVLHDTWIKPSTEQLAEIETSEVQKIAKGIYTLIHCDPEEEGHFWVELKSGLKGFIYSGHAVIS